MVSFKVLSKYKTNGKLFTVGMVVEDVPIGCEHCVEEIKESKVEEIKEPKAKRSKD